MSDQKILVIRFSSIGDIILATSPLKSIRNHFPKAEITFLTLDDFSSILEFHPDIDRLVALDKKKTLKDLWWFADFIKEQQYSHIFDLHNSLRSNFILSRINSEIRQVKKPRWHRFKLFHFHQDDFPKNFSTQWMYHSFLGDVWQDGDPIPETSLFVSQHETCSVHDRFNLPNSFVVIVPGAAWTQKQWPINQYHKLIKNLDIPVVLLGSRKDKICFKIQKESPTVLNLAGKTSLREALVILKLSQWVVGSDTGLVHAAEALGKSVSMILGPTSKKTGGGTSLTSSVMVEKDIWCRPCSQNGKRPCYRSEQFCMNGITVNDVAESIQIES